MLRLHLPCVFLNLHECNYMFKCPSLGSSSNYLHSPFFNPLRIFWQMSEHIHQPSTPSFFAKRLCNPPMCSTTAHLSTGLSQSLHFTTPISSRNGSAPNIFMSSFALSHVVGGDWGTSEAEEAPGDVGRLSQEKGRRGADDVGGLSLRAMMDVVVAVQVAVPRVPPR